MTTATASLLWNMLCVCCVTAAVHFVGHYPLYQCFIITLAINTVRAGTRFEE